MYRSLRQTSAFLGVFSHLIFMRSSSSLRCDPPSLFAVVCMCVCGSPFLFPSVILKMQYSGKLLNLAEDLGQRLLVAFDTPTGIPFGTVNLRNGVPPQETVVTNTATATTFSLEFGILSRLTGDLRYEESAKRALKSIWSKRSKLGLLGSHIDSFSGAWKLFDSSIGGNIDSFFEYLIKAGILFGDEEYLSIFAEVD